MSMEGQATVSYLFQSHKFRAIDSESFMIQGYVLTKVRLDGAYLKSEYLDI